MQKEPLENEKKAGFLRFAQSVWGFVKIPMNFVTSNPKITTFTSLIVFLIALKFINSELNKFALSDIASAFDEVRISSTLLAMLAAFASYAALVMNDRFCLFMIGKQLAIWRTMRASIASYALARTLGYSWATASTARSRLYKRWGLSQSEIGALSFSTAAMVQIGAMFAASFGLIFGCFEIARHGPFDAMFWLFAGLLVVLPSLGVLTLCGSGIEEIKWGEAKLKLPKPLAFLKQLILMSFDKICAAICLYLLLPDHGGWSFIPFLAVFVLAGILGALSGAPGGLGVFEAAILKMAPNDQNIPGAAVALLVYRLIYNIIPLVMGVLVLAHDHAAHVAKPAGRAAIKVSKAAFNVAPQILAILVFFCGYLLIGAASVPIPSSKTLRFERLIPMISYETAHFLSAIMGMVLLLKANYLWRESRFANSTTQIYLLCAIVLSLIKGVAWETAATLLLALVLLFFARSEFEVARKDVRPKLSYRFIAAIIGSLASIFWFSYFAYNGIDYSNGLWLDFGKNADASRALRAMGGVMFVFIALLAINYVASYRPKPPPQSK